MTSILASRKSVCAKQAAPVIAFTWHVKVDSKSAAFVLKTAGFSANWVCICGGSLQYASGVDPVFNLSTNTGVATIGTTDVGFGTTPSANTSVYEYWRFDFFEFSPLNLSNATDLRRAWYYNNNLTEFPAMLLTKAQMVDDAWSYTNITSFPAIDMPWAQNLTRAWAHSSLTSFPLINLGSAVRIDSAWRGCQLTSFPALNLQFARFCAYAWAENAGLTSFPSEINLRGGVDFSNAWRGCGLTSFPALNLAAATTFVSAWFGSDLESFPQNINFNKAVNLSYAWQECKSLTSFPAITVPLATNFYMAWYKSGVESFDGVIFTKATNFGYAWSETPLTSFSPSVAFPAGLTFTGAWKLTPITSFPNIAFPKATSLSEAWSFTKLTSFPAISIPLVTDISYAWLGTDLTTFPTLSYTNVTNIQGAWESCRLQSFPASAFPLVTTFTDAWKNNKIDAQGVENILVALDATGKTGGTTTIGKTKTVLTATAQTAYNSLITKSWTVYLQPYPDAFEMFALLPSLTTPRACAFTSDGARLLLGTYVSNLQHAKEFDVDKWTGSVVPPLNLPSSPSIQIRSLAYSGNGRFTACASVIGNFLYVYDATLKTSVQPSIGLSSATTNIVLFSPDSSKLVYGDTSGTLFVVDTSTWQKIPYLSDIVVTVYDVKFNSSGSVLYVGIPANPGLIAVNMSTGALLGGTPFIDQNVRSLAYCASRNWLAVGTTVTTIYDCATWSVVSVLPATGDVYSLGFNPSGDFLAVVQNGQPYTIYDTNASAIFMTCGNDGISEQTPNTFIFSPDGNYLCRLPPTSSTTTWMWKGPGY